MFERLGNLFERSTRSSLMELLIAKTRSGELKWSKNSRYGCEFVANDGNYKFQVDWDDEVYWFFTCYALRVFCNGEHIAVEETGAKDLYELVEHGILAEKKQKVKAYLDSMV